MKIEGTVHRIRCGQCGARRCTFTFAGDTDMTTDGLHAFNDGGDDELYLALIAAWGKGWNREAVERAANQIFGKSSLEMPQVVDWDARPGLPPIARYECSACRTGLATTEASKEHPAFVAAGGVIHLGPGIELV